MPKDYVDFEVIKEPWNEYSLEDGVYIKTRVILIKVLKKESAGETPSSYGVEAQQITTIYNVPDKLKGSPDTNVYSPEDLGSSIAEDFVNYKPLSEDWCEYFLVDDGTRIRIRNTVTKISRTNKYDKDGNPIYVVQNSNLLQITPKKYT